MPSYNSESYIAESINSVINQTYKNWELIIIDDCSTDNTTSIVNSFKDERIKLIINTENLGAAKSRNKGIEAASGRFIAFLDSDDLWHKEKLKRQIEFMEKNKYIFTYSNYNQINEKGNFIKSITCPQSVDYKKLLKTCYIGCLTAIYDTHALDKVYMPDIRKRQDYALWLKILKKGVAGYCHPESLASYRIHSKSISHNKLSAAKYNWFLYRKIENLNLIQASYYFSFYALNGILRKLTK